MIQHRMARRIPLFLLLVAFAVGAVPAGAQEDELEGGPVIVADIRGPLDQRSFDFLIDAVETPGAQLVVVQLDSPGVSGGDTAAVIEVLDRDTVPFVVWVGPSGAKAYGPFIRDMLVRADAVGASPGARLGYFDQKDTSCQALASFCGHEQHTIGQDGPNDPGVTDVEPTIGLFIVGLDGRVMETASGVITIETGRQVISDDGIEVTVPSVEVRFLKPRLFTRFLRLASQPEAAFFFLLVGIGLAAFEFYAAGVGLMAVVASLALFLAGYGLATLPMDWFAVLLVVVGLVLWTADLQRNQLRVRSYMGGALLLWGGLTFTNTAPQYPPRWWVIVLAIIGTGLFYVFALTTVIRSRFSTPTIGREYLVGRQGIAETGFDPEGTVVVDGATWRARSHRAAGLAAGDSIEVLEVRGIVLEVGPVGDS